MLDDRSMYNLRSSCIFPPSCMSLCMQIGYVTPAVHIEAYKTICGVANQKFPLWHTDKHDIYTYNIYIIPTIYIYT